jgi:hypothetical protein
MASNLREGSAGVVHVTAAAARTGGTPYVEQGWAGFASVSAASGAVYALDCRDGIKYEITKIGAEAKGDFVWITVSTNALSLTGGAGKKLFAKVVEAEGGTTYGTPTGKTLVALLPQAATESE